MTFTIGNATVDGVACDIEIRGATIAAVRPPSLGRRATIDAAGAAVIPGLHDHHVHLFATAAAAASVRVGPGDVHGVDGLAGALRAGATQPGGWVRAIGYHESVAGDLDRETLDRLCPGHPVRLQHRSGVRWVLNSAALRALGGEWASHPTGQLDRADELVRDLPPQVDAPALERVARDLLARGVTGVTDTTPYGAREIGGAVEALRALPIAVTFTGGADAIGALGTLAATGVRVGPVKIVLDEARPPEFDALVDTCRRAHLAGRSVAVHCVDRATVALTIAALDVAGHRAGDRLEHAALLDAAAVTAIAERGLAVVTQPGLLATRGDEYLRAIDAPDELYRLGSLVAAGIPVGLSTDAPYCAPDPWAQIAAAVHRRTPSGVTVGAAERIGAHVALGMFLTDANDLRTRRRVAPGEPADLVVLDGPLDAAATSTGTVRHTIVAGRLAT